jgi:hypothetical protein
VTLDELVELNGEPENVAGQLRAMAGLSDDARARHRFDAYLSAGANIIEAQASRLLAMQEALEEAREGLDVMDDALAYECRQEVIREGIQGVIAKLDKAISPNRSGGGE